MCGPWQLGYMQLKHYTQKHNQVADYMLKADPSIKLIGAGDLDARDRLDPVINGNGPRRCSWSVPSGWT